MLDICIAPRITMTLRQARHYLTGRPFVKSLPMVPSAHPTLLRLSSHAPPVIEAQSAISLLVPPYRGALPLSGTAAPLGSVLVVDLGIRADDVLASAILAHREVIWCPACFLMSDEAVIPKFLAAFEPSPGTFGTLRRNADEGMPSPHQVLQAIRRRPAPTPVTLATYISTRAMRLSLVPGREVCFSSSIDCDRKRGSISDRSLRRHLHNFGLLSPSSWYQLSRLVAILASHPRALSLGAERLANEHHVDVRTLRRWIREFTGVTYAEAMERVGWEWILEAALRRYDYVQAAC